MRPDHIQTLHTLKGVSASILLALIFAGRPLGANELVAATGWSATKITEGLHKLNQVGLVENRARYGGWCMTACARHLALPGLLETLDDPRPGSPILLDSESVEVNLNPSEELSADSDSRTPPPKLASPAACASSPPDVPALLASAEQLFGEPILGSPARYPDADLLLAWIAQAYHQRARLRKPARVVYANLKKGLSPDRKYLACPGDYLPPDFLLRAGLAPPLASPADRDPGPDEEPRPDPPPLPAAPPDPSLGLPAGDHPTWSAAQAWDSALQVLGGQLPRHSFETFLQPAECIRYEPERCAFFVAAPSPFARDWLQERLAATLARLLAGICNRPVAVEFLINEEKTE